jgi:hypothetical protein
MDTQLHSERLDGKRKRTHVMPWRDIPAGAYIVLDSVPHVVLPDRLRPWSVICGYGDACARPRSGDATVLTPPLSVRVIATGYEPQIAD